MSPENRERFTSSFPIWIPVIYFSSLTVWLGFPKLCCTVLVRVGTLYFFLILEEIESEVAQTCPTLCDPMDCSPPASSVHGDSPGKNTGMGYHFLLQEIFPTQVSNLGLPHCKQTLYHLSHQGSSAVKFSPLRIIFAMGLLYMAFIILRYVPSMPAFWRAFYHKWMLNFVKGLLCIY